MAKTNLNKFQHFFYDYGRFHYNKINVWIHILCVPVIVYTLGRMMGYLASTQFDLKFNPIYILLSILSFIYLYVDILSGFITIVEHVALLYFFPDCDFSCGGFSSIQVIIMLHIFSWLAQFVGHGLFEKRKPALLDNVFLMFSAPVFVNIELMIMLFGYRSKEIEETNEWIRKDIDQYRKSLGDKRK